MTTATASPQATETRPLLTTPQMFWLVLQATTLTGIVIFRILTNRASMALLWTDSAGQKLAITAFVLVLFNFSALSIGSVALNRLTSSWQAKRWLGGALLALLSTACFGLLYLPVCFIILVGPAALSIRDTMMAP